MALKSTLLLLLWDLALFVHVVTSFCNVTCSTDYSVSLNCSCSGPVKYPVLLNVKCSGEELEAYGSCVVKPPQTWCTMEPQYLDDVASIGTNCTATVRQRGDQLIMPVSESSSWELSDVVKPLPPFDVNVKSTNKFYNITWDHDRLNDCLVYTVRIRECKYLSKDPAHSLLVETKHIVVDHEKLKQNVNYTVDVKTKMCPGDTYQGPWSEWSSTHEWKTTGNSAEITNIAAWWYIPLTLSIFVVMVVCLLLMHKKPYLLEKLRVITYIPKADRFFKPLYQTYGGDFKEWVKPGFSEYDYLSINSRSQVPMLSKKQHQDILQLNHEKQSYGEDNNEVMKQDGVFLHALQPHSNPLLFYQDTGGSSQGTGHSTGHVSIHTVTLSGEEEEEEEEEAGSRSSDSGQQHAVFDLEAPQMSRSNRQSGILPQHENQIANDFSMENVNFQPRAHANEPERVSLVSFASNEHSEDGYPRVDLDTIDSGFGECSSPGASDSNIAEQINCDLFQEHKSSNSNYVKQWMICSTIQEDSSNSENELQEIQ